MSLVELGFVEKVPSWKLKSKYFPSKVGGAPSWLTLNNLPEPSDLLCQICGKQLGFLLQVYAPVSENDESFHRSIFVFMCFNAKCSKKFSNESFAVFRSQLPRKNDFYSYEPYEMEEKDSNVPSSAQYQDLCDVCKCKAALKCEKCSSKNYCSPEHLNIDWKWGHENLCSSISAGNGNKSKKKQKYKNKFFLPEFELVTENENLPIAKPEKSDEEKMKEYHQFMKSFKASKELQDVPLDELDTLIKHDKIFNKFQKRIKDEPEQVLRYQRNGTPLWISAENIPKIDNIPSCQCGAPRSFEFQIMPQLLNYLSLDSLQKSIDWGTLLIYTCSESCSKATSAYVKEFLWKQDVSEDMKN